jgi:hypothetical protein
VYITAIIVLTVPERCCSITNTTRGTSVVLSCVNLRLVDGGRDMARLHFFVKAASIFLLALAPTITAPVFDTHAA